MRKTDKMMSKINKTPFFFVKTRNSIVVVSRRTNYIFFSYQQPNTKIKVIKDNNLKVYFLNLFHKVIEEKEVTYKFICTLLINY